MEREEREDFDLEEEGKLRDSSRNASSRFR